MSVILGINTHAAGASAALVVDGQPVAAMAEERLNRIKYYAKFPKLAVCRCLDMAGLRFRDIDYVAVGRDSHANQTQKVAYVLKNATRLLNLYRIKNAREALDDLRTLMARECEADLAELRFKQINVEHHVAHIASAYFASPWERAAGFSIDGSGDFVTCMLARCEGDRIDVLRRIYVPHSLGYVYNMICEFIGYGKYGDEGKVMGLAPYGEDTYQDFFAELVRFTPAGFELNPEYFLPFGSQAGVTINERGEMVMRRHYSDRMVERFGPPRTPNTDLTTRDRDLAFGVQRLFEQVYMHLLNQLHALAPEERVAMAGGAVLNSVANGKLFHETPFRETAIQPAAGDEGLALGAALYASRAILHEKTRYVMENAYLGPDYSEAAIRACLEQRGIDHEQCERDTLVEATVDDIEQGKVVGWFQGRMEWGPRALGNRSILANPCLETMKDVLNARIKRREWFRPFAPAVLAERQAEIFEHDHPSPFMLHVYKIRAAWRKRLPAVNHVDDTGRLQSVSWHENPLYYDVIERFGRRTGVPVVLNTSFNENEPIVCTPEEAIDCFERTRMDTLVIGPFLCRKPYAAGEAMGNEASVSSAA